MVQDDPDKVGEALRHVPFMEFRSLVGPEVKEMNTTLFLGKKTFGGPMATGPKQGVNSLKQIPVSRWFPLPSGEEIPVKKLCQEGSN